MKLPPTWNLFGEDHLPHRILLLARMLDRESARQLQEEFDISLAEWRVLAFVCTAGPASAAEIGSAFESDRAEVSRAVARLQSRGFIDREVAPDNRKKLILHATEAGQNTFTQARQTRHRYFHEILRDLDPAQKRQLNDGLQMIATRVKTAR